MILVNKTVTNFHGLKVIILVGGELSPTESYNNYNKPPTDCWGFKCKEALFIILNNISNNLSGGDASKLKRVG